MAVTPIPFCSGLEGARVLLMRSSLLGQLSSESWIEDWAEVCVPLRLHERIAEFVAENW